MPSSLGALSAYHALPEGLRKVPVTLLGCSPRVTGWGATHLVARVSVKRPPPDRIAGHVLCSHAPPEARAVDECGRQSATGLLTAGLDEHRRHHFACSISRSLRLAASSRSMGSDAA